MVLRVAVSIGIEKSGSLHELPGALKGAQDFAAWAKACGFYRVLSVTDEKDPSNGVRSAVTLDRIKKVMDEAVALEPDRLLLYYAGHGTATGVTDLWLLSNFEDDGNEAVNVSLSLLHAAGLPIPQIAVFADACRSVVPDVAQIGGGSIVRRSRVRPANGPFVDRFLSTRLGDIAQEVRAADRTQSFGVFSRLLMRALNGEQAELIEVQPPARRVVTSHKLALWLRDIVPLESGKLPGGIVQYPEALPGWFPPDNTYDLPPGATAGTGQVPEYGTPDDGSLLFGADEDDLPRPFDFPAPSTDGDGPAAFRIDPLAGEPDAPPPDGAGLGHGHATAQPAPRSGGWAFDRFERSLDPRRETADRIIETVLGAAGRPGFETSMGLSIVGARVAEAVLPDDKKFELFEENGDQHLRCHADRPVGIALVMDDGRVTAALAFPDLVGTLAFDLSGTLTGLTYRPAIQSTRFSRWREHDRLAAVWTAIAATGVTTNAVEEPTRYFDRRADGSSDLNDQAFLTDPALALLSAYGLERAGMPSAVRHLAALYRDNGLPIPYDLALIGDLDRSGSESVGLACRFPLMARGFALLDRDEPAHQPLLQLAGGVRPALWTSFDVGAGRAFIEMIRENQL